MTDAPSPLRKTPLKETVANVNINQQPKSQTQWQPPQQQQQQQQVHPTQPQPQLQQQQQQQNRNTNNYDKKTRQDMVFLRRQKLKEQLDEEMEEYKFEMVSRNKANYTQITNQSINIQSVSNNRQIHYNNNSSTSLIEPIMNGNQALYYPEPKPMMMRMNNNNMYNMPQPGEIGRNEFDVNRELDFAIKKYADNLDKLKVDEFMSRKKIQDDLLKKINTKLTKINHEINDKLYQENKADEWMNRYTSQINDQDQGFMHNNNQPIRTPNQ